MDFPISETLKELFMKQICAYALLCTCIYMRMNTHTHTLSLSLSSYHVLVHSTNAYNGLGCTQPKPGVGDAILDSHVKGRDPTSWAVTATSLDTHGQETGIRSGIRTRTEVLNWYVIWAFQLAAWLLAWMLTIFLGF